MLTKDFDKETPAAYLAGERTALQGARADPGRVDLRDLTLDLLGGAVAGFYRDDEGKLYVISKSGQPGPAERFNFAHEYDHALQDQNSTIFKDQQDVLDQGDRLLARQAIYEGDATLLMTQWAAANLTQAELAGGPRRRATTRAAQAVLDRTPAILSETLTFPYTTGLSYVQAAQAAGGWPAVDAFFTTMPRVDRADPPPGQVHGQRGAGRRRRCRRTSRPGSGPAGPSRSRTRSASSRLGIWLPRGGRRSAGRAATPRPAGVATASRSSRARTARGPWRCRPPGTRDADAAAFEKAAATALEKATGDAQVLPGRRRQDALGRSSRNDAKTSGTVAGGARARPADGAAYIESGAEIPSRPSAFASVIRAALGEGEPRRRALGRVGVDDPGIAVERVERGRELGRVGRDAVGLLGRDGVLDDLREAGDRPRERGLRAHRRAAPVDAGRRGQARPRPPCAGSRRSGRARTGRSRRGSRSTASWPARCRSRCRSWRRVRRRTSGRRRRRPRRAARRG